MNYTHLVRSYSVWWEREAKGRVLSVGWEDIKGQRNICDVPIEAIAAIEAFLNDPTQVDLAEQKYQATQEYCATEREIDRQAELER